MICSECKQEKEDIEFSTRVSAKNDRGGKSYVCKNCSVILQSEIRNKRKSQGLCIRCGKDTLLGNGKCSPCNIHAVELRHRRKEAAVKYLGGKCQKCGLEIDILAVYDFHHRDPQLKEVNIKSLLNSSWNVLKREVDKCDLLCSNCHRILHAKLDRSEI